MGLKDLKLFQSGWVGLGVRSVSLQKLQKLVGPEWRILKALGRAWGLPSDSGRH